MGAAFVFPWQAVAAVPDDAWGAFSGMAGSCWAGERELSCFEWEFPGEMMRQVTYAPEQGQGEVRYQLDAAGTGVDGDDGSHMHAPRPGVTVREVAGSNPMRITYRHQDDKLWITIERQVGGRWAVARAEQRTRATEAQIEAAHAAVQAMRDASRKDWGVLTDLAGRHFLFQGRAAYAFYWTEAGRDLVFQAMHEDGRGDKVREISLDPEQGTLVSRVKVRYGNGGWLLRGDPEQAFPLADGGFYFSDPGVRVGLDGEGNLTLQPGKARKSTGGFEPGGPEVTVAPAPRAAFDAVAARSRQAGQRMHQAAVEAERARRAAQARESDDGGGIFGALVGAAVGAYAGSAAGLDSAQTLDLMVQGAAVTSGGNPVVDAFARGMAEESAKQEVLRQGYEDAIADGIARGSAEYARRQGGAADAHASASGTSGAGLVIADRAPAPAVPRPEPPKSNTRERYIICEVILNGNFDGNNGALFQSAVGKAILVDGRVQGNPEASFLAKVRSAHGKGGVPVCETGDSPAALQRQLQEWRKGYPHYKLVQTGMTPL